MFGFSQINEAIEPITNAHISLKLVYLYWFEEATEEHS